MKSQVISLGQYVVLYFDKKDGVKYRAMECKDGYIDLLSYDPKGDLGSIRIQPLPMEHPEGWPHSHEEILSKFENGKERYERIALFRQVIEVLVRGKDYYEVMDQILTSHEALRQRIENHIKNGPAPVYVENMRKHFEYPVLEKEAYPKRNWWTNIFYKYFR